MSSLERAYRTAAGDAAADTQFRVRFHETDAMGIVHHASHICWFEEGRSALTRSIGYPYARLEAEGVSLAVVEVSARYLQAARYDEEVVVSTCLQQLGSRGLTFAYTVRRAADRQLLATGKTKHIAVDPKGRVVQIPAALRVCLQGRNS